jgi:16S rRNA processing protein RimM
MSKGLIRVGLFGAPHGVRGEVRLKSYTQNPASIGDFRSLTDAGETRVFEISALRPIKDDMFVARVRGIADRDAAQALTNVELYVRRENLPAADEDEFYHADLIGLRAETAAGETLGRVVAMQNFGAGDLVEIALEGTRETLLIPFTKACVPEIDLAAGRLLVQPPDEVEVEAHD